MLGESAGGRVATPTSPPPLPLPPHTLTVAGCTAIHRFRRTPLHCPSPPLLFFSTRVSCQQLRHPAAPSSLTLPSPLPLHPLPSTRENADGRRANEGRGRWACQVWACVWLPTREGAAVVRVCCRVATTQAEARGREGGRRTSDVSEDTQKKRTHTQGGVLVQIRVLSRK